MRDVVTAFFHSEGIELSEGAPGTFAVSFAGDHQNYDAVVRIDERAEVLAVWSTLPIVVDADRRAALIEKVCRLNCGHVIGNLEIDVDSAVVRMKTSIDYGGEELTEGFVANLVWANVASADHLLPALLEVAVGAAR